MKKHFKTFPEFSWLTLADKEAYEELIADYQPCILYNFGNLMNWWELVGEVRVSTLNDNLVLSLWCLGLENESGLSVIGNKKVDETICTILDWLKETGRHARLVHVPEFVLKEIKYPDMFAFSGERDNDECIVDIDSLTDTTQLSKVQRSKIRKLTSHIDVDSIQVEELDLSNPEVQDKLLYFTEKWSGRGGFNDIAKQEEISLKEAIRNSANFDYLCIGVYIEKTLHAFFIYSDTQDKTHALIFFARFSYELPNLFELTVFYLANWFKDQGVKTVNIESDVGLSDIRSIKLSLGPSNFVRMYTVRPKK